MTSAPVHDPLARRLSTGLPPQPVGGSGHRREVAALRRLATSTCSAPSSNPPKHNGSPGTGALNMNDGLAARPVIRSYEPADNWCYVDQLAFELEGAPPAPSQP